MPFKRATPFAQVDANRAGDADRVNARVIVKALILGRDDRVFEVRRYRIGRDHAAELITAPGEHFAISVEQGDRSARATVDQAFDRRQGGQIVADGRRDKQSHHHRKTPTDAPDDLPNEGENGQREPDQKRPLFGWLSSGGFGFGFRFWLRLLGRLFLRLGLGVWRIALVGHELGPIWWFRCHGACPAIYFGCTLQRFLANVE